MNSRVFISAVLFILSANLVGVVVAQAAALFHIQGTLISFTDEHYLIERAKTIYYIKRSALSEDQRNSLKKTGTTVEVAVPPSAIELVKSESK